MDSFSGYGGMYPSNCTFIQSVNSFPVSTPHTRNEHGYFNPVIGATIDQNSGYPSGRYKIIRVLGTGVYGTVLECEDKKHGTPVAIKLCRARPEFETAALGEIRALRDLEGRHGTPALLRSFQYEGHICMAFNMLGENLKSVIDRKRVFSLTEALDLSHQFLTALAYIHSKGLIHTDLKTDNVLVRRGQPTADYPSGPLLLTIIDVGSAIYCSETHPAAIGTQEYRAPEAILQSGWHTPVDLWGAGCVLAEICMSRSLFPLTHSRHAHLCCMQTVVGAPIPALLLSTARRYADSQNPLPPLPRPASNGFLPPPAGTGSDAQAASAAQPLAQCIPASHQALLSVIRGLIALDPTRRIAASEALAAVGQCAPGAWTPTVAATCASESSKPAAAAEAGTTVSPKPVTASPKQPAAAHLLPPPPPVSPKQTAAVLPPRVPVSPKPSVAVNAGLPPLPKSAVNSTTSSPEDLKLVAASVAAVAAAARRRLSGEMSAASTEDDDITPPGSQVALMAPSKEATTGAGAGEPAVMVLVPTSAAGAHAAAQRPPRSAAGSKPPEVVLWSSGGAAAVRSEDGSGTPGPSSVVSCASTMPCSPGPAASPPPICGVCEGEGEGGVPPQDDRRRSLVTGVAAMGLRKVRSSPHLGALAAPP
eukprot:CAMPEP_0113723662 /NCGR_PEP_ID=MMETSP0038_2-20120614/38574_1 /TAXON_ID=2898 /ORGANISM="Cryptomonas paramecium" /LENGTH=647 /DNA_ID=CAMNT_0000653329 /DNA_START=84 /DNA_END=2023 /DNA_ORIENTATION=+ /assembly_acc=CAM_ASM_000170